MNPEPNLLPLRLHDWERDALALDDLHVALNHAQYLLRQVLKANTLKEAKRLAKEGTR
jgi:hypothetical protein